MRFLILAFILSSFLVGSKSQAQQRCAGLLRLPHIFESKHLKQVKTHQDSQGFEYLHIRKKFFKEWFEYKVGPDNSGDIRWGAQYLPANLRVHLDLKSFDKENREVDILSTKVHRLQIPAVPTVIDKYKTLEAKVRKQYQDYRIINFYETSGHANSDQNYLERFSYETLLPFSNRGYLFEHDLNYHVYSSLVIPPQMTKALQSRVSLVLEFKSFIQERSASSGSASKILKVLNKTVLPELVERVDISTGNMFQAVVRLEKESLSNIMIEVGDILDLAFIGQTSPRMYLLQLLNRPELGEFMLPHLHEFLDQLPEKYKNEDLTKAFVGNPAELYNEARAQFKLLNSLVAD